MKNEHIRQTNNEHLRSNYGRRNRQPFLANEPVSYPKQFLDILGTGKTLIQQTFDRFARLVPAGKYLCGYCR